MVWHGQVKEYQEMPAEEKDDNNNTPSGPANSKEEKAVKASTSDPDSGWFCRGESWACMNPKKLTGIKAAGAKAPAI